MTKQRATTYYTRDARGNQLAHVAVNGTRDRAVLHADDLARILDEGWSPHWSLQNTGCHRYVLVWAHGPKGKPRTLTVARLVANAGKGEIVRYADGDRLNLRRDNLLVRKGTAWTPVDTLRAPGVATASGLKCSAEISVRGSNTEERQGSPRAPLVPVGRLGEFRPTGGQSHV